MFVCLPPQGTEKAKEVGFINFQDNSFDVREYEYYEQVEHGDLNWIVPGKFLAFSGPSNKRTEYYGYRSLVPEDYIQYFKHKHVTGVVRLNKKVRSSSCPLPFVTAAVSACADEWPPFADVRRAQVHR